MSVIQIQFRRDTAANWTSANPVLAAGEQGLDTTNNRLKMGDGTTAWNSLAYLSTRILSGAGAPAGGLGVDGDLYFDTTNKGYYIKASGSWGSIISLQGATGSTGATGPGVPNGGTAKQILAKNSATNQDTAWVDPITFPGTASPAYAQGKLVYDTDNESLTFFNNDSNVGLQIGQEQWIRVKNVSGSTITNGSAVYITGANAGLPTIGLAKADASATATCVGIATESIANNAIGYVTALGLVHGLNTTGFTAGDVLYLSAATAGAWTNVRPSAPNFAQRIGTVVTVDPSVGSIKSHSQGTGLGYGSANQLLGMNSGGTGQEYKTPTALTALLDPATTSLKGLISAADKKKLDNVWYDVTANPWATLVGDDATDNSALWDTFFANVPTNATVFFPPGTYRCSANGFRITADKHLQIKGAGQQATVLKTTSTTGHIFDISGIYWYNTFADLAFTSSVTKTAGAAINISTGSNVFGAVGIDVDRCSFTNLIYGIDCNGLAAGNLSVWSRLNWASPAANGRMIRVMGGNINSMIVNCTANSVPGAGAISGSANIEVQSSGALQIVECDLIGAVNSLLLNAQNLGANGTSIAAVYCTNTYFDQSGGSTVKITGPNTTNRIKFTQCGIAAGTASTHAVEVAGTGTTAVGAATSPPAGISFVDCDIYYAPGGSTASGIHVNGCGDINIQNCRSSGFSGSGGSGVRIIPNATPAGATKVRVNGCIIGPNSNLTIFNEVGIRVDANTIGALSITDNTVIGNGTAITDASTIAAGNSKNINNNLGAAAGLQASFAGATALSATEAVILQIPLPANSVKVGTVFRFQITGTSIVTVTTTARVHVGPLGTTADPQVVTTAASAAGVAGGLVVSGAVAITAVGGSAAGNGAIQITTGTTTGAPAITASGTFNSAVANFVTVGLLCSAAGHTVRAGTLDIVSPA